MRKSYLRNIVHSFKQAVPDAIGDEMPGAKNIVSFVKDPTGGEDTGIRAIIDGYKKDISDIKGIFSNLKKSLKTGKLYDRGDEEKAMMAAMGIDTSEFDFSEDDLFGENEDKPKKEKKSGDSDDFGMDDFGDDFGDEEKSSSAAPAVTNVNIFKDDSSDAGSQFIAGAAMAGAARTTSAIERGTAVNYALSHDIDERLSRIEEANNRYYATSLELLGSIKSNTENLAKGMAARDTSLSASQIEKLFGDGDSEFNMRLYIKGLHEKFEDTFNLEMMRMAKGMLTPGGILKMGIGAAIMKIPFVETIKKLTDMTEGIGQILLNQMANVRGNGPIAKLFRFFGVKTQANLNPGANKYEKGPVPFDGITRRSIVQIIPELLSDIRTILAKTVGRKLDLKAIAADNKVYDWESGSWSTTRKIQNKNLRAIADMPMAMQLAESIVDGSGHTFRNNDEREEYKLKIAAELINSTNGKSFNDVLNSKSSNWLFRQVQAAIKRMPKSRQDAYAISWDRELMTHINSLRAREKMAGASDMDYYGIGTTEAGFKIIEARDRSKVEAAEKWINDNREILRQSGINSSDLRQKLNKFHREQKNKRSKLGTFTNFSQIDYYKDFLEIELKSTIAGDRLRQQLEGSMPMFNLDDIGAEVEAKVAHDDPRLKTLQRRLFTGDVRQYLNNYRKANGRKLSKRERRLKLAEISKINRETREKISAISPFEVRLEGAIQNALELSSDFTDDEESSKLIKTALNFMNNGIQNAADKGESLWRTLKDLGDHLPIRIKSFMLPKLMEFFPDDPEVKNGFIKWAQKTTKDTLDQTEKSKAKDKFYREYGKTESARESFFNVMKSNNVVNGELIALDDNGNPIQKKVNKSVLPDSSVFATGGYTGQGEKYDVAGIVHKNEYVVPSEIVASPKGRSLISKLEAMRLGYADGGFASIQNLSDEQIGALVELASMTNRSGTKKYTFAEALKRVRNGKYNANIDTASKGAHFRNSLQALDGGYNDVKNKLYEHISEANNYSLPEALLDMADQKVISPLKDFVLGTKTKIQNGEITIGSVSSQVKESMPAAAKGAGIGLAASFFLPGGPLLGAFAGGVLGVAKQNETFRSFLFGKKNKETGEIEKEGVLGKVSNSLVSAIFGKDAGEKFKQNKASFLKDPLLYMKGLYHNHKGTVIGGAAGGLLGMTFGPEGALLGGLLGGGIGHNIGKNGIIGKVLFGKRYTDAKGNVLGYSGGLYQMAGGLFNAAIAGPMDVLFFGSSLKDLRDPKTGNYDPKRISKTFRKNAAKTGALTGAGGILGMLLTGGNPLGALVGSSIGLALGFRNALPAKILRTFLFGSKAPDAGWLRKHGLFGTLYAAVKGLAKWAFKLTKFVGGKVWGFIKKNFPRVAGFLKGVGQVAGKVGSAIFGTGKMVAKGPFAAIRGALTKFYGGNFKVLQGEDLLNAVYKDPKSTWADKGIAQIETKVGKIVELLAMRKVNKTEYEQANQQAIDSAEESKKFERQLETNKAKRSQARKNYSEELKRYNELKANPMSNPEDIEKSAERLAKFKNQLGSYTIDVRNSIRDVRSQRIAEARDAAKVNFIDQNTTEADVAAYEKEKYENIARSNGAVKGFFKKTFYKLFGNAKKDLQNDLAGQFDRKYAADHQIPEAVAENGHAVGGLVAGQSKSGRALGQFLSRFRGSAAALLRKTDSGSSPLLAQINGERSLDTATQGALANTRAQMVAAQMSAGNSGALGDLLKVGSGILSLIPGGSALLGGISFLSPFGRLAVRAVKGVARGVSAGAKGAFNLVDKATKGGLRNAVNNAKFQVQYKIEQGKEFVKNGISRGLSFLKSKISSAGSALKASLGKLKPIQLVKKFAGYLAKFLKTYGAKFLKYAKSIPKVGALFAAIDGVIRYNGNAEDGQSKRQKIRMLVVTSFEVLVDCLIMFIMSCFSVLSGGVAAAIYVCVELMLKFLSGKDIAEWLVTPLRSLGVTDWIGDIIADLLGCPKDGQEKEAPDPNKMAETLGGESGGHSDSGEGETEGQSGSGTIDVQKKSEGFFGAIKSFFTGEPRLEDYVEANGHNLGGLKPGFKHNLAMAAKEYYETYGEKLKVNSAFRTTSKQQELFTDYLVDKAKGRSNTGAAAPGRSNHQTGLAIDINSRQVNKLFGVPDSLGYQKTAAPGSIGAKYGLARLDSTNEFDKAKGTYKESWHVTPSDEKIYRAATQEIRNLPENVEATKKAFEAANRKIGGGKGYDYNDFSKKGKAGLALKSMPGDATQVGDGGDHSADMLPAVNKMIEMLSTIAANMMAMNSTMSTVAAATQATASNTERQDLGLLAAVGAN